MKKENALTKVGSFLKKNIYYVLLIACIVAVGVLVALTAIQSADPNGDIKVEAPDVTPDDGGNETPNEGEEETPDEPVISAPIVFGAPVAGEVLGEYSDNALVYCTTLKQWQTHSGIDYACSEGESVKSVYAGTVYSVKYDILNGNVVTVDHGNGLMTKYGSLGDVGVKEGDKVEKGDELGKAGNTAMSEVNLGTHLHFETILDGVSVNPGQYDDSNK